MVIKCHRAEGRPKETSNVEQVIGCFLEERYWLCQSQDVKSVQDAGCLFNKGGNGKGGVGRKKAYMYSSFYNFLVQLVRYDNVDSYPAFFWLTNTIRPSLHLAQPPGTWDMRIHKMRFSTHGENSLRLQALRLDDTQSVLHRPHTSPSKLSSSQVVPTVQPCNSATNMCSSGKGTYN